MTSCSNPRCQALQHQVYLLQEEFEESKMRVTSFEKTVAQLQQEKNSAMEQCSLAKVEVITCICNNKKVHVWKGFIFSCFER